MDRIKSDQVKRDNIGYLDNMLTRYKKTNDVMEMFRVQEEEAGWGCLMLVVIFVIFFSTLRIN